MNLFPKSLCSPVNYIVLKLCVRFSLSPSVVYGSHTLGGLQLDSRTHKGILETLLFSSMQLRHGFACASVISVKYSYNLTLVFNLSLIMGKNSFVTNTFVVRFH